MLDELTARRIRSGLLHDSEHALRDPDRVMSPYDVDVVACYAGPCTEDGWRPPGEEHAYAVAREWIARHADEVAAELEDVRRRKQARGWLS